MHIPKIPADLFDALGLISLTLAFLLLAAFSPVLAFAVGVLVLGVAAERRLDLYHRATYWWDKQRNRFGA